MHPQVSSASPAAIVQPGGHWGERGSVPALVRQFSGKLGGRAIKCADNDLGELEWASSGT